MSFFKNLKTNLRTKFGGTLVMHVNRTLHLVKLSEISGSQVQFLNLCLTSNRFPSSYRLLYRHACVPNVRWWIDLQQKLDIMQDISRLLQKTRLLWYSIASDLLYFSQLLDSKMFNEVVWTIIMVSLYTRKSCLKRHANKFFWISHEQAVIDSTFWQRFCLANESGFQGLMHMFPQHSCDHKVTKSDKLETSCFNKIRHDDSNSSKNCLDKNLSCSDQEDTTFSVPSQDISDQIEGDLCPPEHCNNESRLISSAQKDSNYVQAQKGQWLLNFSKRDLSEAERHVLTLGFNFAVIPKSIPDIDLIFQLECMTNNITDDNEKDRFRSRMSNILYKFRNKSLKSNFSKEHRMVCNNLRKDKTIKILKADKGNATVVLDISEFDEKVNLYLNQHDMFTELKSDPTKKYLSQFKQLLDILVRQDSIDYKFKNSVLPGSNLAVPSLFCQVKIHKENRPLRPIVNFRNTIYHKLARVLANMLNKMRSVSSFSISNNIQFLEKLSEVQLSPNSKLISFDIQNMYNSIPIDDAINCIHSLISSNNSELGILVDISLQGFIMLLEDMLKHSYFVFKNRYFLQTFGLPMGSPIAPIVAELFISQVEKKIFDTIPLVPSTWLRYVDDIFAIWTGTDRQLSLFLKKINSLERSIKFTIEYETNGQLPFLDIMVKSQENVLKTSVYRKYTHTGRYISFESAHPYSVKLSIATLLFRRAKLYCSVNEEYDNEVQIITQDLLLNNYPQKLIKKALNIVKNSSMVLGSSEGNIDHQKNKNENKKWEKLFYFPGLSDRIQNECKKYDKCIANVPYQKVGTLLCKPQTFDKFNKQQIGVVYCISCQCGEQYIGETGRSLQERLKEHSRYCRPAYSQKSEVELANLSPVAVHAHKLKHEINWEKTYIVCIEPDIKIRKFKEAVAIMKIKPSLNLNLGTSINPIWRDHVMSSSQF